jgi:LuxR family maltose regulon positive regulatory protein
MRGRMEDAESGFAEALIEGRALPDTYSGMAPFFALGRVQEARGKLGAALRTYREGLRFATEDGRLPTIRHAAEAHAGIAHVLYQRNQLDDALRHVTAGMEFGGQVVDMTTPILDLVLIGWIRHALGEEDAALEAMNDAFRLRPSSDIVGLHNPAPTERARLMLAQGRIDDAAGWSDELGLTPKDEVSYPREREYLVLVRVLLARADPAGALELLERLGELAESHGRTGSLIEIRALRALALQSAGEHDDALATLDEAVTMAGPEGYVRLFADEGPPMAALFRSLIGARQRGRLPTLGGAARQHLKRLVKAFAPAVRKEGDAATTRRMPAALTDRELEVLRLIAGGKRNQEIARELVVTLETVKKHVSHIFDKLGAASRTEAVAHARDLGLIS